MRWKLKSAKRRTKLAEGLIADCTTIDLSPEERKSRRFTRYWEKIAGKTHYNSGGFAHFDHLSKETDPLECEENIQEDSVKSINVDTSIRSDGARVAFKDNRMNRRSRRNK
jgi:hypothetical protein